MVSASIWVGSKPSQRPNSTLTFKWNEDEDETLDSRPIALQAYRISTADLAAKFEKVEAVRAASKKPNAYAFIPIEASDAEGEESKWFGVPGGALADTAELMFEAPIVFSDRGAARIETSPVAVAPASGGGHALPDIASLVLQHKQALATIYGTSVEKIRILIEA